MAYMIGDEGPYPNLVDEYCGNCSKVDYEHGAGPAGVFWDKRAGRPRPSATWTTAEMEAHGTIGLYLKVAQSIEDTQRIRGNVREVPTPPELMEPATSESAVTGAGVSDGNRQKGNQ